MQADCSLVETATAISLPTVLSFITVVKFGLKLTLSETSSKQVLSYSSKSFAPESPLGTFTLTVIVSPLFAVDGAETRDKAPANELRHKADISIVIISITDIVFFIC